MYGVFVPSKKKPLKTFNCLRSAAKFADDGYIRAVFDIDTEKELTAGTIPRTLKEFLNRD
tara:strand:+ start:92392 stop:92571 length:180 start_codon:yes stop_codon:yes gene_type:complete